MRAYADLLNYLYSVSNTKGMKLGLENTVKLGQLLGFPNSKFQTVHVAGTNGKGSVTAKVAKGLESLTPKVGIYTSPHISTFRERIRINNEMISETDVELHLSEILDIAERANIAATFFELTTLLAFKYFAAKGVKMAVIETGLGGRLDATNILTPILSVITSIQLDHTEILGKTLESIAKEKAGIIKKGVPVVLGPSAFLVPYDTATQVIQVNGLFKTIDEENRSIAKAALQYLNVPEKEIRKALTTRLPCRQEEFYIDEQKIILDVSHNPQGLAGLFYDLGAKKEEVIAIVALSRTKDHAACLKIIQENAAHIHLVGSKNERCTPPSILKESLIQQGAQEACISLDHSTAEALKKALHTAAKKKSLIVICGTFFIMSQARQALGIDEICDPLDLNNSSQLIPTTLN